MKIAHIADIHLGNQQYGLVERFNDFAIAWMDACHKIVEEKPDICIIAGDLFHTRQITPETLSVAISGLTLLQSRGIITYTVEGNHEQPRTADETGWIEFLADEGYIRLLHAGTMYAHDYYCIYGLPWMGHATNQILTNSFDNFISEQNRILILHAGYTGIDASTYEGTITHDTMGLLREKFKYIALGHVHKPYADGKVFNPGSLETCSATEAAWLSRGIIIWEDGDWYTIKSRRRPFYRISEPPTDFDPEAIYDVGTSGIELEGAFYVIKRRKKDTKHIQQTSKANVMALIRDISTLDPELVIDIRDMALRKESPERIASRL